MKNYIKLFLCGLGFSVSILFYTMICNYYNISMLHNFLIIFLIGFANNCMVLLFFCFYNKKSALSNKAD